MTTHLTRVTFPMAVVLLLLAGCSHPATDAEMTAEMTAANKAFVDCVWTATTQLDDGKSDPVSVAYGIEPSCAVQSNQLMNIVLQGARTEAGVLERRQMWPDHELKVVVSAILTYRKSQAQRASPPAVADPVELGAEAAARGDYATALRLWRPLADQGNAAAQVRLGMFYENGRGVPRDYAEAARWYRKAANQGVADAQANLGYLYENGHGVPQDYAEAARWVRMAAEQGVALAQVDLAFMYYDGRGVPHDNTEAARWFRMAAEQGDAGAQDILGGMCFLGEGVPRDYVQSYMWLSLAVAGGWQGAAPNRDKLNQLMTPEQIADAQQRTAAWQKAHAGQ
jgi:hypothetical protein